MKTFKTLGKGPRIYNFLMQSTMKPLDCTVLL